MAIVMSDFNPFKVSDAAYLYGNTPDNEISILEGGLSLYRKRLTNTLVIGGTGPYRPPNSPPDAPLGYSGGDAWRKWLVDHGVRDQDIVAHPTPPLSHTGTDADAFVRLANLNQWRVVTIVACPAHMLRAFANTVGIIERQKSGLLVYSQPGTPLPWDEVATSSQGNILGPRMDDAIKAEWDRLGREYNNPYDVASAEHVIRYVKWRDKQVQKLLSSRE